MPLIVFNWFIARYWTPVSIHLLHLILVRYRMIVGAGWNRCSFFSNLTDHYGITETLLWCLKSRNVWPWFRFLNVVWYLVSNGSVFSTTLPPTSSNWRTFVFESWRSDDQGSVRCGRRRSVQTQPGKIIPRSFKRSQIVLDRNLDEHRQMYLADVGPDRPGHAVQGGVRSEWFVGIFYLWYWAGRYSLCRQRSRWYSPLWNLDLSTKSWFPYRYNRWQVRAQPAPTLLNRLKDAWSSEVLSLGPRFDSSGWNG